MLRLRDGFTPLVALRWFHTPPVIALQEVAHRACNSTDQMKKVVRHHSGFVATMATASRSTAAHAAVGAAGRSPAVRQPEFQKDKMDHKFHTPFILHHCLPLALHPRSASRALSLCRWWFLLSLCGSLALLSRSLARTLNALHAAEKLLDDAAQRSTLTGLGMPRQNWR